jgi:hypothetical protein
MALTRAPLPINLPTRSTPWDSALAFGDHVTMTTFGWVPGAAGGYITVPRGRFQGLWNLQVFSADVSSTNETYQFFLYGSNDPNFGNGNLDLLGMYDIAATSALRVPTGVGLGAAWPGLAAGTGAAIYSMPVSNERDVYTFEFINLYCEIGGTTPSITFSSWISPWTGQKA